MAYNLIPKTSEELIAINNGSELLPLYNDIVKKYKINDPFAFDPSVKSNVKVVRSLEGQIELKHYKFANWKASFGNGSRGNTGTQNRGNLYEAQLAKALNEYMENGIDEVKSSSDKQAVMDIVKTFPKNYYLTGVRLDGELNQARPLQISSSRIVVGKQAGNWDIGKTVTDITLTLTDKNNPNKTIPWYLSLKYGSTVTLVNAGVKRYLMEAEMKKGKVNNQQGKLLLDLFNINNEEFCHVFNSYTGGDGSQKRKVDITNKLKSNTIFKEFMRSVIGYGYILVHKVGQKTHVLNMDKKTMESMLNVYKAEVLYPVNGNAKRIDVLISMSGIEIKINIRNKQGGLYPSHIMADYKIMH